MKHVIPVVTLRTRQDTRLLFELAEGGLPLAEITFRTPYAAEGIRLCARELPSVFVGAGSVVNEEQAKLALGAGARFLVSPGLSEPICRLAREAGVPYLPCAVTPAEIMHALGLGIETVKFFPASVYGGIQALKALSAPFPTMKFVPTGGVTLENLKDYLSLGCVAAVGGSFMTEGDVRTTCKEIRRIMESAL